VADGDSVVAIARNAEASADVEDEVLEGDVPPVETDDQGSAEGGAPDEE
jgi:hypothetical protein